MKQIKYIALVMIVGLALQSCFDLEEKTYSEVDSGVYYQDENSVKGAVASIYGEGFMSYIEYFWYLAEFPADQITWRVWYGGLWGYDEGEKYVLGIQNWNPNSTIIRLTWETSWKTIGLCNEVLNDLESLDPAALKMTQTKMDSYIAEVRTLRAWCYYNVFEVWGGALPLNISSGNEIPPTADPDFDVSSRMIYDFMMTELDQSLSALPVNDVVRMNKAVNRIIKARLLFNSGVFVNQERFTECADLCQEILDGKYGSYSIVDNYQDIYSVNNYNCPEVIMAFACKVGQLDGGWMRNMPFLPYNIWDYTAGTYNLTGWNCVCLTPSFDNSGTINVLGGTSNPRSFITDYGDKLGAIYERFDDRDIRKQNYVYDEATQTYKGMFLKGAMRANFGTGEPLKADADRDGQDLVYVDQVGTFQNRGRNLEDVMSPRWGETNSGLRMIKYPILPSNAGSDFRDAGEVEFRLAEVIYMLAECKMRAGDAGTARTLVNGVRKRYYSAADWAQVENSPGPGFTAFDMDWMLSEWGKEFLGEGRRRRTDLRRHDKFTQGQWWFHGRATEDGVLLPAKRDRKYEWYPLPASALTVNPGLIQNPNYQ